MAGLQRSRGRAGVQRRPVRSGTEAAPERSKAGPADPLPLGLQALSKPRAARRLFSASARSAEALRGATGARSGVVGAICSLETRGVWEDERRREGGLFPLRQLAIRVGTTPTLEMDP